MTLTRMRKSSPEFQTRTSRRRSSPGVLSGVPGAFFLAGPAAAGIDRGPPGSPVVPVGPPVMNDNGAIAQLGERYNGIVEVSGSIPLSSTTAQKTRRQAGFLLGSFRL